MAVSDPPFSTPRIMKVLDPGTGHYEVIVRMDPTAASKFPDEPFGTGIDQIGLAQKDASKYVGYTLVSIEPADKGAKDHYWVFQKLDGPEFTTISKSKESLTPAKYRSQTVAVKTEREVAFATQPSELIGDLMSSTVSQIPNTGKSILSETTEVINSGSPLFGLERNGDGSLSRISETLVEDGAVADSGQFVIKSEVTPIGNGKSIKVTVTADTVALSADNPALNRTITRVTPLGTDVLFTEVGVMPSLVPVYGSPHYDTVSWPNHKLVLIKPIDDSGARYKFFYAANRENQDLYNWEIVAGTDLTRTYLIPRNLYRAKPVGDVDALDGEFLYPPAGVASPDSVFSAYCFVDDTVRRVDESLDSIYVTIQRRFIEPITSDYIYDDSLKKSIRVLKEVIPSTENGAPTNPQPGTVVEIKKGNFFHNVKITQTIVLGVGVTYPYDLPDLPGSYDRAFPAKLDSISLVAAWAEADSSTHAKSYSEDYYFKFKITEARPGPYSAVIKRYVTNNPSGIQASYPVTIVPQPVTETIAVVASWFHASTKGNSTFAIAKEWSVPATIHGLVNVDVGGVFNTRKSTAYYTESVAATPGAATFLGLTQITSDFKVRQLPLGLYEVSVVIVNISNLY